MLKLFKQKETKKEYYVESRMFILTQAQAQAQIWAQAQTL